MTLTSPTRQRVMSALAAFALLLQVAVPVGFMPSSVSGGWYIELCPDGLPTEVLVELYGEHHAHHGSGADSEFYQCDYGAGSSGNAQLLDGAQVIPCLSTSGSQYVAIGQLLAVAPWVPGFHSRAPPSGVRYS